MFNRKIIKYLERWKNSDNRKPLILRGARQVGKTVSIKLFAQKFFKDIIYINLENPEYEQLFRNPLSLDNFEKIIQLKFQKNLKDGETLLFIDEIQNSPSLIKLLRFFYENRPGLHVISAGSLLEVKLKKEGFAFPVGRVEYAYLHPLDFFEFLEAKGEMSLLDQLKDLSLEKNTPEFLNQTASALFNEYLIVGGMPEVVQNYIIKKDLNDINRIYNSLLTSYTEDMYKYTSGPKVKYLVHCFENAPVFAGQNITYEHFSESVFRSREMAEAFEVLEKSMLIYRVMGCKNYSLPLMPKNKKAPKLLFLDAGLVNYKLGIRNKLLNVKELDSFFHGKIAEQIVGQHLLNMEEDKTMALHYWYRDMPGSSAEVDFMFTVEGKIIALEVKSGKTGRLKSLNEFVKVSGIRTVYRIYSGLPSIEEVRIENTKFNLISLPFYLLPRLKDFIH